MAGWFVVKRGTLAKDLFAPKGPFSKFEAWVWMVESAAYQETTITRGKTTITVPRGNLHHSIRFMAGKWRWSEKAVRTFISALESEGAVEKVGARSGARLGAQLRLCNYDKYQLGGHSQGHAQGHKEERNNKYPYGEAEKSASFETVEDAVWGIGKAYLTAQGVKNPGNVIGRWLKGATPVSVLEAIQAAQRAKTQDPVPYIVAALKPKPKRQSDMTARELTEARL